MGIVQGVGFRPFVYRLAVRMGLKGHVLNNGSNVEIVVDRNVEEFISALKAEKPPLARIDSVEIVDGSIVRTAEKGKTKATQIKGSIGTDFRILFSHTGSKDSDIPVDVSVCEHCLAELGDPKDRRYLYPFTNCTDCGARFSLIRSVPYDRANTSMKPFDMCPQCLKEYKDPSNRRFHAQTISCFCDGPKFALYAADKEPMKVPTEADPFQIFAAALDSGKIGLLKSWGGMHIISNLDSLGRLRQIYPRPKKPFAIMVRNIKIAKRLAEVDSFGQECLELPQRPIVILPKRKPLPGVSDGLDNIGIYIPYSPIQHILFHHLDSDAVIMTSANHPGQPMLTDNENALRLPADIYLLHDRDVVNCIDDTVMIPYKGHRLFIRKSRGFVPDPIQVGYEGSILSLGAQRNVTSSISKSKKIYTTQYIGNIGNYDVLEYLKQATAHMLDLIGTAGSIETVAIDKHPAYTSRQLLKVARGRAHAGPLALSDLPVQEVQHHFAHAVSLMVDQGMDGEMTTVCVDGMGYGDDGQAWGGEVLSHSLTDYKRTGHLEYLPQLGGDQAVMDPRRLVFGIFHELGLEYHNVTPDEEEVFSKLSTRSVRTSSLGRVLDALAFALGICEKRTYDGEPAMSTELYLESGLKRGSDRFDFHSETRGEVILTKPLFEQLYGYALTPRGPKRLTEAQKADICYGFLNEIMRLMAEKAGEGGGKVGITGGAAYSLPILKMLEKHIGHDMVLHDRVPPGDGGISIGQNAAVGYKM